jgi:hypothetical protein
MSAPANAAATTLTGLLAYPRETLDTEMKGWLDLSDADHQDDIAKAMLALANHGGGFIVIGYTEVDSEWVPDPARPTDLSGYTQDRTNGIVARYAEPSFHCELHTVTHPESGELFPVIAVPGGHKVPIRAKSEGPNRRHTRLNAYYVRRPGPASEVPQSGREWDELIARCIRNAREDLLESFRVILEGGLGSSPPEQTARVDEWFSSSLERFRERSENEQPELSAERYQYGYWAAAYTLKGDLKQLALPRFLDALRAAETGLTGWNVWWVPDNADIAPMSYDGTIECWLIDSMFADPGHSDFWRAAHDGSMFLLRGYNEDGTRTLSPGTVLDLALPIWHTGEVLLHAASLARVLGDEAALVTVRLDWNGLAGRRLTTWTSPGRDLRPRRPAVQDSVSAVIEVVADRIDGRLPELVKGLLDPLYAAFDFFEPSALLVQEELNQLRSRRR